MIAIEFTGVDHHHRSLFAACLVLLVCHAMQMFMYVEVYAEDVVRLDRLKV